MQVTSLINTNHPISSHDCECESCASPPLKPTPRHGGVKRPWTESHPSWSPAACSTSDRDSSDASSSSGSSGHGPIQPSATRARQLRVNEASKRCRQRQKMELTFLRTHIVELQNTLKDQLCFAQLQQQQQQLPPKWTQATRLVQLAMLLDRSIKKTQELAPGIRPNDALSTSTNSLPFLQPKASQTSIDMTGGVHQLPFTSSDSIMSASTSDVNMASQKQETQNLLVIAGFIQQTMRFESRACVPQAISALPIDIDGWKLRMAIDEKHHTSHLTKFFPSVNYADLFDFCWDKHVTKTKCQDTNKQDQSWCRVTPLSPDVAQVDAQIEWLYKHRTGQQLRYKSLVCRQQDEQDEIMGPYALICQQSIVDPQDQHDSHTVQWIFKRWLSFQPHECDGVKGTLVESFRTGSFASGMCLYQEEQGNTRFDDFCAHLIRRYVQCNALLESLMAKDPRFRHVVTDAPKNAPVNDDEISELLVRDLLMF